MPEPIPSSTPSFHQDALRQKILRVALQSIEFRRSLDEAAKEIRGRATPKATEATIEGAFERIVYAQLREIGLQFHPEKEESIGVRRHVANGRMDSRLGALILEYKKPSLLSSKDDVSEAIKQLTGYLIAHSVATGSPVVGILTNGIVSFELRADGHTIENPMPPAESISGPLLLRLTEHFISLAHTALTPANLIRDFCKPETGVLFKTARLLNTALGSALPKTLMLYSEWEQMFRLAHDDQSQQKRIQERRESLAHLFEISLGDADTEYRALFSLHTAYAILLKFMAYRTVSDLYLHETGTDDRSLAAAPDSSLRVFCNNLEDGEVFRKLKIVNLLEGDFFSWYSDEGQWTAELANTIREILLILARYEEAGNIFEASDAPDVFKDLYQAAVPRVVRSSLGEFYTPGWLAEHVLESSGPLGDWRAIDPCCGSGTFVVAAIAKIRKECKKAGLTNSETLQQITSRVAAIDLNPLGVLTTRINYFIHISNLLGDLQDSLVVPVYLGDAAAVPNRLDIGGVACLKHELKTLRNPVNAILPVSLVQETETFMLLMLQYERAIQAEDRERAITLLTGAIVLSDQVETVLDSIAELTDGLIELEHQGWNGIWARILSNFFTTACLGKFDIIMGNPPWIDWKNLPIGYRNRIKDMCVERGLFSGAGRTGGINLNICALIAYVAMTNWLAANGRLAFLMPRELVNQASYEGWRRLGGRWSFHAFHDWSKAGHPFDPVKEDFLTFLIGDRSLEVKTVPITAFKKKTTFRGKAASWKNWGEASACLEMTAGIAGQVIPNSTAFTFAAKQSELDEFSMVAGECHYVGREGVEFYPQELLLFRFDSKGPRPGQVWLKNIQVQKSKYRIHQQRILLETTYLHPLVKGPEVGQYSHSYSGLIVAFPYDREDPIRPVSKKVLQSRSPHLLDYYENWKEVIDQQNKFSDKIRGGNPGEFYGLARTGPYSFANTYVAFRDNSKWCATVITGSKMPWGESARFVFQNHAVSICENNHGAFITEDEAHFICAILNTKVVERFIYASSDGRSYKIRPPVFVPPFNPNDDNHLLLSQLSREAHLNANEIGRIRETSEAVYLRLCKRRLS